MEHAIKIIDAFNARVGRLGSYLVLPLVGVVFYEVLMRYLFNAPTVWGFEMTVFIYGVHYMLGLAHTEGANGHVRVEILTDRFSRRGKAIFGVATYGLLFAPVFSLLAWACATYAWDATASRELNPTSWAPPIWPLKILMAFGFVMLFAQGVSSLLKNIAIIREKA